MTKHNFKDATENLSRPEKCRKVAESIFVLISSSILEETVLKNFICAGQPESANKDASEILLSFSCDFMYDRVSASNIFTRTKIGKFGCKYRE